ncbi:hypothetical protein ACFE04_021162 [Oxalis oulophora]
MSIDHVYSRGRVRIKSRKAEIEIVIGVVVLIEIEIRPSDSCEMLKADTYVATYETETCYKKEDDNKPSLSSTDDSFLVSKLEPNISISLLGNCCYDLFATFLE